jgi:hypothetical protein
LTKRRFKNFFKKNTKLFIPCKKNKEKRYLKKKYPKKNSPTEQSVAHFVGAAYEKLKSQ